MREEDIINEYETLVKEAIERRNTTPHVITRRNRTNRTDLENDVYYQLLETLDTADKSQWPKDRQDQIYGKLLNILYSNSTKLIHLTLDPAKFAEHAAAYPELIQYLGCVDSIQHDLQISALAKAINKNPQVFAAMSDEQISTLCEKYPSISDCCIQNIDLPPYNEDSPDSTNYIVGEPNLVVQLIKCNPELRNSPKIEHLMANDPILKRRIEIYDLQAQKSTVDAELSAIESEISKEVPQKDEISPELE